MAEKQAWRTGCELHGALRTIQAIEGLVPIVHSNAGCAMQCWEADRACGLAWARGGLETLSTAAIERHVIFGGGSRLREQIKNSVKVVDGQGYVVLSGCEAAMVGDDIPAMVKESVAQGQQVLCCETAGFHGAAYKGYESAMTALMDGLSLWERTAEPEQKSVNIFGVLPVTNPFYRGDLDELTRLLAGIGVRANVFFRHGGLNDLRQARSAALSVVLSGWGEAPARVLQRQHQVPYLTVPHLPVGVEDVAQFLRAVTEQLHLDSGITEAFLASERERYNTHLQALLPYYYEARLNRPLAVVGDAGYAAGIAGLLCGTVGADLRLVAVVDGRPEGLNGLPLPVSCLNSRREIEEAVCASGGEVILGSALERPFARRLGAPLMEICYPLQGAPPLAKSYIGINGALRLLEEYMAVLISHDARGEDALAGRQNRSHGR